MRLSEDYMQELRDNNDIISVAQSYVDLKRSGSTYACRCPFHSEKSPSCHFYQSTNSFYCFGCGVGGDVITFIRLIENLDYMEAVRFLAQRAGMSLPEEKDDDSTKKRRRIYEMNREAGSFFHKQLFSDEGRVGLEYLMRRGLTEHTIKRFGLGYASGDYHKLHFYLKSKGFSDYELVDASLLVNNNNKVYDKFRNRVMFPIFDTRGNVAAFGGRALVDDKNIPKYLNSAETQVFHKTDMLFALNYAKNSKADYFILCEGYMDVISMHQAGFDSAVASLGTSLTEKQANLISRLGKKEVILSYDSDEPGQKASARGINLLSAAGVRARVLKIDGAKDPDEFIKKYGADAFRSIIEKAGSAIDFGMDKLSVGLDLNTEDGKSIYLKNAVKFLSEISNDIDRAVYITKAAKLTGIPAETIKSSVDREYSYNRKYTHKKEQNEMYIKRADKINPEALKLPREERAERMIICFLFHNADRLNFVENNLKGDFVTAFNKKVYEFLVELLKNGEKPNLSLFNEEFVPEEMGRITQMLTDDLFAYNDKAVLDCIKVLNDYSKHVRQKDPSEMSDEELEQAVIMLKETRK